MDVAWLDCQRKPGEVDKAEEKPTKRVSEEGKTSIVTRRKGSAFTCWAG